MGSRFRKLRGWSLSADPRVIGTEQLHAMLGLPPPSDDTLFQARESVTAQETEDEDDEDDLYVTNKAPLCQVTLALCL